MYPLSEPTLQQQIKNLAKQYADEFARHPASICMRNPELSYKEFETKKIHPAKLTEFNL
jgi:metal-dependent amidase/aminoacylase/carboxypeptidase family protein